jgi:starvation-inducible outer membrane lipoprotein
MKKIVFLLFIGILFALSACNTKPETISFFTVNQNLKTFKAIQASDDFLKPNFVNEISRKQITHTTS